MKVCFWGFRAFIQNMEKDNFFVVYITTTAKIK